MTDRFVFGRVEVLPAQRQIFVDGCVKAVGARAFDLLLALIERRDRLVTKSELFEAVWPGMVVCDNNIAVQVGTLRRTLGTEYIATIPGRGYRFVAPAVQDAAPVGAARPAPSALPATAPPLVGRDADLAHLRALTRQHRLVTLTGAGGIGKTQLAKQLLHEERSAYAHGAHWAELGALAQPSLVAGAIASALAVEVAGSDSLTALARALRPLSLLVILDNAEHLTDEVARVAHALLDAAPNVRLLVTSQVPLGLTDEQVMRLQPLAVPPTGHDAAQALEFGAVALFVRRAQAADRRFTLSESNVAQVIDICQRLDGLPLAIELAAARVSLLGLGALATALNDRLRVLRADLRDAPARQQTLRAALEWSHGLLDAREQAVLRRLAVFAGTFSLDMARQVVAQPEHGLDGWDVLDAMGVLLDRSLITVEAGEPPRYRLLETTRVFGLAQLAVAGEDSAWRARHARAVLARFEQVYADRWAGRIRGDDALDALAPDLDNAHEALAFALLHDSHIAVALTPPLSFGLRRHGNSEIERLLTVTRQHVTDELPVKARAAWFVDAARFWAGRLPTQAADLARTAIDLYREVGDPLGLYRSLIAMVISDFTRTGDIQRKALAESRALENPAWPARQLLIGVWAHALVQRIDGDLDAALTSLQRVRVLADQDGDSLISARTLMHIADVELLRGRPDETLRHGMELAEHLRKTRMLADLPTLLRTLVAAWLNKGDAGKARAVAEEGWPLALQMRAPGGWADFLALLAALEGRMEDAAMLLGYSDADHAARQARRELIGERAMQQAEGLVRGRLAPQRLHSLRTEGRMLRDEDIARLVFPDTESGRVAELAESRAAGTALAR